MVTTLATLALVLAQMPSGRHLPITSRQGASDSAIVQVNDVPLAARALIRDDRVLVPMRAIFERLGATVQWYPENHKVVATKGDRTISLIPGQNFQYSMESGGQYVDYPPRIIRGRLMVPLRFVSENLGAQVHWNPKRRVASVVAGGSSAMR